MQGRKNRGGRAGSVGAWLAFALFIQLAFAMPVGTNPTSRFATLAALSEDFSFRVDPYQDWTIDWARGPDGHYYSNKAPGPALLGFPVYKILDLFLTRGVEARADRDRLRHEWRGIPLRVLSLLFQILPFLLLAALWERRWRKEGHSPRAARIAFIALLMGTSATVFLNSYFGHGLTAVCLLALVYVLRNRSPFGSAFFFGWGLLCEYSVALLLLPLLVYWGRRFAQSREKGRWARHFFAGASLPAIVWVLYHVTCFGGLFHIANQFQNPLFVDFRPGKTLLWGLFALPDAQVMGRLLWGMDRGIFWTQPWVLFLFGIWLANPPAFQRPGRVEAVGAFVAFGLFFLMNASFNGWHGGSTPGPRYLAPVLPLLAFALVYSWDAWSSAAQRVVAASVLIAVFWQISFLSVYGLPPENKPLWQFYFEALQGTSWSTPAFRLAAGLPLAGWLFYQSWVGTRASES